MKHVVSVSLGSSTRDHSVKTSILNNDFLIERIGTNGDMLKAIELIKQMDGKVHAFGMGGIDLYISDGKNRYLLKDAKKIADTARITPIVDGSGLKSILERRVIEYLAKEKVIDFYGKEVFFVCGADRFGMAKALVDNGAKVTFGDLIFGLNIPILIKSLKSLSFAVRILGPIVSQMPFAYLYPTGSKQEVISDKPNKYYEENDIIAGDFLYIKKHLPQDVSGKIFITNTVTASDIELLSKRGARMIITTTPEFKGRSFGTNVMEAVLVALLEKPQSKINDIDYHNILDLVKFQPRIINLTDIQSA